MLKGYEKAKIPRPRTKKKFQQIHTSPRSKSVEFDHVCIAINQKLYYSITYCYKKIGPKYTRLREYTLSLIKSPMGIEC